METVLDALIVTLGLDPSGYKKGAAEVEKTSDALEAQRARHEKARDVADKKAGDAQRKRAKEMEAFGKKTSDTFDKVRNQALALAAVFTAGMGVAAFVRDTVNSIATIGRLSTMTDMSTKRIAGLQLAFKEIGGTAEEANSQILKMSNDLAQQKTMGGNADVLGFLKFGGSAESLKDAKSYMEGMAELLGKLDKQRGTPYAWFVAQQMGVSATMFQLMRQGPQAFDKTVLSAEGKTGINPKMAEQMQVLQKRWADFLATLRNTGLVLFQTLQPALEGVLGHLQKMAQWAVDHKDTIKKWVLDAVAAVERFVKGANDAAQAVGGWKNVLLALAGIKLASAVLQILSLATAVVRLGAALGGLGAAQAASGLGIFRKLLGLLPKAGVGAALLFHSEGLNKGEDEELARMRRGGGGVNPRVAQGRVTGGNSVIAAAERKWGLPPGLLDSVWAQESSRGKNMRSKAGALGHFQFMPATAAQYGLTDPNDLAQSADAAGHMYSDLLKKYHGNLPDALAAYNWGAGNLDRLGMGSAPAETRNYVRSVLARMAPTASINAYAASMPTGARAGRFNVANSSANTTVTTTANIGQVIISTKATDAQGIASTIEPAIRDRLTLLSWPANTGMG